MKMKAFLAAAVLWLGAGPVAAQGTAPEHGQVFGHWVISCNAASAGKPICVLTQRVVRNSDQAMLAEFVALWTPDLASRLLLVRVPTGVYLPSGIAVGTQGKPGQRQFVWQLCNGQVCEALLTLDDAIMKEMTQSDAKQLVGYQPRQGQDPVIFELRIDGLVEGMEALKASKQAE